ncbi:sensor histidine kinase [Streptomyces sp. NPDC012935]|uniref:sensor histidine kinase n=1 Tax=Streptomyces sp. NPDC012935 TaxID=3364857 RepID=UPI0036A7AACD
MRGPGMWWRGKSTPAKVETYTRWSFHFFAVIEVATLGLPAVGSTTSEPGIARWLLLMVCAHAVACAFTASRALDWTRGRRAQPLRAMAGLVTVALAVVVAATLIVRYGPNGEEVDTAVGTVLGGTLAFTVGTLTLGVGSRQRVFAVVAGTAVATGLVALPLGSPVPAALGATVAVFIACGILALTSGFSVWLLNAVYELDEARETRARLAVAEERLRFGRDLHDVMGRNLSVIALKSELAVQLARRGRPEAVEQMIEVQRIAGESQREVRDVVRGYREVDLEVELAGAQGVLTAAGIECRVTGRTAGLPVEVQSALAWVVREGTTNVLRHGNAGRCSVGVTVSEGHVVLTVENDGAAGAPDGGGGSGLAGLRERLAAVDGTLDAGHVGEAVFRLVAEVPLAGAGVREVAV